MWRYYSDFIEFDFSFYSLKCGIRRLDQDKKVFMVEEPTVSVDEYRRLMLQKRFDVTVKECHALMKVGWEAEV